MKYFVNLLMKYVMKNVFTIHNRQLNQNIQRKKERTKLKEIKIPHHKIKNLKISPNFNKDEEIF